MRGVEVKVQAEDRSKLRAEIEAAIAAENFPLAHAALLEFWAVDPSPAAAAVVVSRFEKLRTPAALTPCRLAVLRSFTLEPVVPLLRAAAFAGGIDLEVRLGDFNAYTQDIVDASSWLYAYNPQAIILAVQTRDVAPALWQNLADLSEKEIEANVGRVIGELTNLVATLRARSSAYLILHGLQTSPSAAQASVSAVGRINAALRQLASREQNVYVLDYDALVARHGAAQWTDEQKWVSVRLPIAADRLIDLARQWMRFLHPICGRICKCLVSDLDNILWGGVIGEDGLDGIQLDSTPRGRPFQAVQQAMLDLHHRGILLAIVSKNNPDDALQAIEKHPGMILRPEHFAARRINWNDKAANLREIATELNIGVDSLAFMDDNPVERQWVRRRLPEVTVIDLPVDPGGYASALRDSPVFERLVLTEEDLQRGQTYAQQRARTQLQSSAGSLEDFYRSLEMEVEIAGVTPANLARVAQLTQKTNQFNLTTRRYTERQIADLAAVPGCRVYAMSVADRLGDNGLVGVAITRDQAQRCEVETFLLSCRVIGRTVETALLAQIAQEARQRGAALLGGFFLPTWKNAPARDFFKSHGFSQVSKEEQGSYWELDLAQSRLACPDWIKVKNKAGGAP